MANRYLITLKSGVEPQQLETIFQNNGITLNENFDPVILDGKQILSVTGPANTYKRLTEIPEIFAIHADSEISLC